MELEETRSNTSATFLPSTVNVEDMTVDVCWTTGARALQSTPLGEVFYEDLEVSHNNIDLTRLNSGAPLLNAHKRNDIYDQIGVVEKAWVDGNKGLATVKFSKREEASSIFNDVKDGIIRNISVGYKVIESERSEDIGETPCFSVKKWEPFEISFLPVPADAGAQTRSEKNTRNRNIALNKKEEQKENKQVDELKNAVKLEQNRVRGIYDLCHKFDCDVDAEKFVTDNLGLDQVRSHILDNMSQRTASYTPKIEVTRDATETLKTGIEDALAHRTIGGDLSELGRGYRNMSMFEMAKSYSGSSALSRQETLTRAMSTSDFPKILANVAQKTLLSSYEKLLDQQNFWPLAKVKSAQDFKSIARVRAGELPSLEKIEEGAEYTDGNIAESIEQYNVSTYGKKLSITRKMIVNDDLSAFDALKSWGAAISRLETSLFWKCITDPSEKLADGKPLIHKAHGNILDPKFAELNIASLSAARVKLSRQKGLNERENDYLGIDSRYLIVPPELQTLAQQLVSTTVVPSQFGHANPFAGALQVLVSNSLRANQWLLAASVDQGIDMVEMAYLDGQRKPFIDYDTDWKTDSLSVKCRMDIGAKAIDYRGFVEGQVGSVPAAG